MTAYEFLCLYGLNGHSPDELEDEGEYYDSSPLSLERRRERRQERRLFSRYNAWVDPNKLIVKEPEILPNETQEEPIVSCSEGNKEAREWPKKHMTLIPSGDSWAVVLDPEYCKKTLRMMKMAKKFHEYLDIIEILKKVAEK